jgi:hypothetical protein
MEFLKPPTVAVYKKSKNSTTHYMVVTEKSVDIVNNANATKPVIDHRYEILELGVGQVFIDRWQKKYKIKKYQIV